MRVFRDTSIGGLLEICDTISYKEEFRAFVQHFNQLFFKLNQFICKFMLTNNSSSLLFCNTVQHFKSLFFKLKLFICKYQSVTLVP